MNRNQNASSGRLALVGGTIVDGTGAPSIRADLLIDGGTILEVGSLEGREIADVQIVDVSDLVVCPGFIDLHAHSDAMTLAFPEGLNKITQGITSELAGNCGKSLAPIRASSDQALIQAMQGSIDVPGLVWDWESVAGYLARVDEVEPAVSVGMLVGHLPLRGAVVGLDQRPPSDSELDEMCGWLEESLAEGAFGLSLGLMSPPSSYGARDEFVALGRVLARADALMAVHMRDYGDHLVEAVEEVVEVALEAGCRLQISHLAAVGRRNWGKVHAAMQLVEDARRRGADIAFDIYPYLAGSTNLTQVLPRWALDGGRSGLLQRLGEAASRAEIIAAMEGRAFEWGDVILSSVPFDPSLNGGSVDALAVARDQEPRDFVLDLLEHGDPTMVMFGRSEDDLRAVLQHPLSLIGSDGLVVLPVTDSQATVPHPRAFGTYPGLLERYVVNEPVLGLEDAIRKCTSGPAARIGLHDRGVLAPGLRADIVAFRLETVRERSTYVDPRQYAEGIEHVLVAGRWLVRDGVPTRQRGSSSMRRVG